MMQSWLKISGILCAFGFVREIRPSEPFITEFLSSPYKNVTDEQLLGDVYPMGTYSYLAQLFCVFLITDFLLYKPLIITIGLTGIVIWSMLLWTTSYEALMVIEFLYGTYMAAEVAYYTYIYAKVDKKYYPRVTSHTRAAMFAGKLVAGISAQLLVYFKVMDYRDLNYITLATQIIATFLAFALPRVDKSIYFHRKSALQSSVAEDNNTVLDEISNKSNIKPAKLLWLHFNSAYTNPAVLQYSIWYALGLCGYLQVIYYVQFLWKEIQPESAIAWNGGVDAVFTALAALFALLAGYIQPGKFKPHTSIILLAFLSVLEGGAVLLCSWTQNVYISYVGFILFGAVYGFSITIVSAEVARHLEEDSFGLVFGINTLMALIIQTVLTLAFVSNVGFALHIKGQYTVTAFYFIIIGIFYFAYFLFKYFCRR